MGIFALSLFLILVKTNELEPDSVQPIEEIELGTKFKQPDPDADLYTPWGQWGPCCPTSKTITEQTRSRACLDDQATGGTKCQDYRNKSYEKRVSYIIVKYKTEFIISVLQIDKIRQSIFSAGEWKRVS